MQIVRLFWLLLIKCASKRKVLTRILHSALWLKYKYLTGIPTSVPSLKTWPVPQQLSPKTRVKQWAWVLSFQIKIPIQFAEHSLNYSSILRSLYIKKKISPELSVYVPCFIKNKCIIHLYSRIILPLKEHIFVSKLSYPVNLSKFQN